MKAVVIDSEVATRRCSKGSPYKTRTANKDLRNPKIYLADLPKPGVGPTDVLIKVRACGLCGSDAAMTTTNEEGFVHYPFMMSNFIVPGHEFSGTVERMGRDVRKYWPSLSIGEPVTTQCVLNCGYCSACKVGAFDNCTNGDELGFTRNGGLAEFCAVDMRHVWSINPLRKLYGDGKELFLAGSLVEPHAGVFKAIMESNFSAGQSVLIFGLGPIGLAALNVFRALGAGTIIGCDPSKRRRTFAKNLGASFVWDPLTLRIDIAIQKITQDKGVSIIFEASGVAEKNWPAITNILLEGPQSAQLIFFGQSTKDLAINPQSFIQKYLRFSGSHGHTKVWEHVIKLFAEERIRPLSMITKLTKIELAPDILAHGLFTTNDIKTTILL